MIAIMMLQCLQRGYHDPGAVRLGEHGTGPAPPPAGGTGEVDRGRVGGLARPARAQGPQGAGLQRSLPPRPLPAPDTGPAYRHSRRSRTADRGGAPADDIVWVAGMTLPAGLPAGRMYPFLTTWQVGQEPYAIRMPRGPPPKAGRRPAPTSPIPADAFGTGGPGGLPVPSYSVPMKKAGDAQGRGNLGIALWLHLQHRRGETCVVAQRKLPSPKKSFPHHHFR